MEKEIKSIECLDEIIEKFCFGKDNAIDIIQNISYLLQDNGYWDAKFFTDDLIEYIEENYK